MNNMENLLEIMIEGRGIALDDINRSKEKLRNLTSSDEMMESNAEEIIKTAMELQKGIDAKHMYDRDIEEGREAIDKAKKG